jgi:hypothetical protein
MHAIIYRIKPHTLTYVITYTQVGTAKDTKFCLIHASGDTVKLRADNLHDADQWVTKLTTAARKVCIRVHVGVYVCMYTYMNTYDIMQMSILCTLGHENWMPQQSGIFWWYF